MTKREIELGRKVEEMTRWWCMWNRKECTGDDIAVVFGNLFHKETMETWNSPLEELLAE